MRLRLLGRVWPKRRRRPPDQPGTRASADGTSRQAAGAVRGMPHVQRRGASGSPVLAPGDNGGAQSRPVPGPGRPAPAGRSRHAAGLALGPGSPAQGLARAAVRAAPASGQADVRGPRTAAQPKPGIGAGRLRPPWYEIAQSNRTAPGRRHCGHLEHKVHREWAEGEDPPPAVAQAIDRLAELPQLIKVRLAAGLDGIHVGVGGVPDLDDMGRLSGVPLPSGRATWDACAGAYGERKIVVGSRLSPTPDVMCHEIGHALDDLDGAAGEWQSDSAEFMALYEQCQPAMRCGFHRQQGVLGRREFFADAFAAIASRQRPALVDMLGGDTRAALNVMLYFNVRYGI